MFGTDDGELTSIWSDHLIGRPENHMTGVSFTRGGYHRIGKRVTNGAGGYTDPPSRALAVRRHRHRLRRRARRGGHDGRLRVRRLRLHLPRRPAVPDRRRRHARRAFEILGTAPAAPSPAPPRRGRRSRTTRRRSSSSPGACSATRDPEAVRASPTATPCSAATRRPLAARWSPAGCTDWAHGLAGRDPQVERITAQRAAPPRLTDPLGVAPRASGRDPSQRGFSA